ncbi:hypothetical protein M0805_006697 [Coniferiporia weirii]|nr:hypothetical protein M0805_006697 [Coniferiporia weirii]
MDQDAFRKLLVVSRHGRPAQAAQTPRGSLLPSKVNPPQQKPTDAPKSEFKPRKVKKTDSSYRDRAAERRKGVAGDFAEVEAVLESFEKQHADEDKEAVERQRRYLGGDSEHTVLVKGLDFALLEQTRARAAASTSVVDDEMLEAAFHGAASPSPPAPSVPSAVPSSSKKRTREDLVRELKQKRAAQGQATGVDVPADVKSLEEAKKGGNFKPIGFKPIGAASTSSKTKDKDGKERKKKKRKVEAAGGVQTKGDATTTPPEPSKKENLKQESSSQATVQTRGVDEKPQEPEPPEDFDIFAEAGEYEGVNFDDDDDGDTDPDVRQGEPPIPEASEPKAAPPETERPRSPEPRPRRKWFDDDEPPSPPPERALPSRTDAKGKGKSKEGAHSGSPDEANVDAVADADAEEERPTRLAPLASSAVPSIRDILAADSALEAERKRRARKEKRKAGGGNGGNGSDDGEGEGKGAGKKVAAEAKLNRDYQKLKAYTEKKGASK